MSAEDELEKLLNDFTGNLQKNLKTTITKYAKVAAANDKLNAEAERKAAAILSGNKAALSSIAADLKTLNGEKTNFLKKYTDLIKKTDGLTSVRPAIAKNLDRFTQTLDMKFAREATKELEKQKQQVVKQSGKNDKAAKQFCADIDKLIDDYL